MEKACPLIGKPCIEHGCKFYRHVVGQDPQSGAQVDVWDCAIAWIPKLLIENAQQQRQTAAAVETLRNSQDRAAAIVTGLAVASGHLPPQLENK